MLVAGIRVVAAVVRSWIHFAGRPGFPDGGVWAVSEDRSQGKLGLHKTPWVWSPFMTMTAFHGVLSLPTWLAVLSTPSDT